MTDTLFGKTPDDTRRRRPANAPADPMARVAPLVRPSDPQESHDAAHGVQQTRSHIQILTIIRHLNGEQGINPTWSEIWKAQEECGIKIAHSRVSTGLTELSRMGFVEPVEKKDASAGRANGRQWVMTEIGAAWLESH